MRKALKNVLIKATKNCKFIIDNNLKESKEKYRKKEFFYKKDKTGNQLCDFLIVFTKWVLNPVSS